MTKIVIIAFLALIGLGRPDKIHSDDDKSLPAAVSAAASASVSAVPSAAPSPAATLEYSGVKLLKTEAELMEFVRPPRLTMIYFKPEVALSTEQKGHERVFLDAAKVSLYGFFLFRLSLFVRFSLWAWSVCPSLFVRLSLCHFVRFYVSIL